MCVTIESFKVFVLSDKVNQCDRIIKKQKNETALYAVCTAWHDKWFYCEFCFVQATYKK